MKGHHVVRRVLMSESTDNLYLPSGWKPFASYQTVVPATQGPAKHFGVTYPATVILCREWVRDAD